MKTDQVETTTHAGARLIPIFLSLLIYGTASASPAFGPLQGIASIGAPVSLYTTLFGLSTEQLTQLQPGCLEAKLKPSDISDLNGVSKTQTLILSFDRTIRTGGMLKMTSPQVVSDPTMTLRLSSFCPTVSFTKEWRVLLSPADQEASVQSAHNRGETARVDKQFKLSNSALLQASRRAPNLPQSSTALDNKAAIEANQKPAVTPNVPVPSSQAEIALSKPQSPSVGDQTTSTIDQNAKVEKTETGNHLIQSSTIPDTSIVPTPKITENRGLGEAISVLPLWWLPLVGILFLTLTMLAIYWYKRKNRRLLELKNQTEPQLGSGNGFGSTTLGDGNQEFDADALEPSNHAISTHLFQSLMGGDTEEIPVEFDFTDERPRYDGTISSSNPVDLALSLINRDELPEWNLPRNYIPIIQNRNTLIHEKQEADFKYFKLGLTLIELCFQNLHQNRDLDSDSIARVQTALNTKDLEQFQSFSVTETVPDLIKSFVNEKIIRLDDATQRENMMAQLKSLGELCAELPLCFKSSAWAEFLFHVSQEASISSSSRLART